MPILNKFLKQATDEFNDFLDPSQMLRKTNIQNSEDKKAINQFFVANSKFVTNKSIQKNFKFIVEFDDQFKKELINNYIYLFPYHVLSIEMPTSYSFKYDSMKVGPYSYSFPTMDHNGFDISVVFEEDEFGSIAQMIHHLQSKIIGDVDSGANGNYFPQTTNRIKQMTINIYNDGGIRVRSVYFDDVFFTGATATSLNYDANESIKYTITFHSDFMQQEFIA